MNIPNNKARRCRLSIYRDTTKIADYLTGWIKEHIETAGAKGAVLGISGGIDSAVLTGLLCRSIGKDRVMGVIMPCHSQPGGQNNSTPQNGTISSQTMPG